MDYKEKYLKYKSKYLKYKKQQTGGELVEMKRMLKNVIKTKKKLEKKLTSTYDEKEKKLYEKLILSSESIIKLRLDDLKEFLKFKLQKDDISNFLNQVKKNIEEEATKELKSGYK